MADQLDFGQACAVLGVTADAEAALVHDRYRQLIREHHPDVAGTAGTEATIQLNLAMQVIEKHWAGPQPIEAAPTAMTPEVAGDIAVVDDALRVEAPPDELYVRLAHALDIVGNLTYTDASSGYLEATVSMGNPSPSQLVVNLQGRGAHTEAFFTLEAMGVEEPPDLHTVVAAIAEVLAEPPG